LVAAITSLFKQQYNCHQILPSFVVDEAEYDNASFNIVSFVFKTLILKKVFQRSYLNGLHFTCPFFDNRTCTKEFFYPTCFKTQALLGMVQKTAFLGNKGIVNLRERCKIKHFVPRK